MPKPKHTRKTKKKAPAKMTKRSPRVIVVRYIIVVGAACMMVMISGVPALQTLARLDVSERFGVVDTLQSAIGNASATYRYSAGLRARQRTGEKVASETSRKVVRLAKEKREVRLKIAAIKDLIATIEHEYHIDVRSPEGVKELLSRERDNIVSFVRYLQVKRMVSTDTGPQIGRDLLRTTFHGSFGDTVDAKLRSDALQTARTRLFSFLFSVQDLPEELDRLQKRHAELIVEHQAALGTYEEAQSMASVSATQLEEIKRTMAEVHEQVLKLQGELARIDARLARRAERVLIEKGLRDARPGEHSDGLGPLSKQLFAWPVYGRVSAGFHNEAYQRYFGVPHYGTDIVVGQGTAVRSAADGIVFLVRDGGEKGYTYILIGHRGGYATLYGHLSETSVVAGDDVDVGDVIGLSGGEPGTYGAGPMTTGSHLHFEVIVNGMNIDPKTVLP